LPPPHFLFFSGELHWLTLADFGSRRLLYSVLETLNAKQHQTEEGQRMVNQYRLGPTIGKGGYATVEKGIDVGTGKEYVRPLACHPSEVFGTDCGVPGQFALSHRQSRSFPSPVSSDSRTCISRGTSAGRELLRCILRLDQLPLWAYLRLGMPRAWVRRQLQSRERRRQRILCN
jgi:hypothetical protein